MSSSLNVGAHLRRQFDGMATYTRNKTRWRDSLDAVRPSIDRKSSARFESYSSVPRWHASTRSSCVPRNPIDSSAPSRKREGNRRWLTTTTTATSCHFVLDARLVYSIATLFLTIYPFRVLATAPNDIWFSSIAIPPLFRQSTPLFLPFYPSLSVPVLTCLLYFFSFGFSIFVVRVIRIDVASLH